MKRTSLYLRSLTFASLMAMLAPGVAAAAVVYVDLPDVTITRSVNGVYLDLNGNAPLGPVLFDTVDNIMASDYTALGGTDPANAGFEVIAWLSTDGTNESADFVVDNGITLGNGTAIAQLVDTNPIDAPISSVIWSGGAIETGDNNYWDITGNGYIGIAFDPTLTFDDATFHFGWVRVSYDDNANTLTILDYAYETTPNTSLLAGDGTVVPEPGSLALLSLGGLMTLRRRRHPRMK